MKTKHRTPVPDDIATWLQEASTSKAIRCRTCRTEAQDELRRMLEAMLETKCLSISRQKMYDRLKTRFPEWARAVSFTAFRNHLMDHEPTYSKIQAARHEA